MLCGFNLPLKTNNPPPPFREHPPTVVPSYVAGNNHYLRAGACYVGKQKYLNKYPLGIGFKELATMLEFAVYDCSVI